VIPHVDESLIGKVLMKGTKLFQPKNKQVMSSDQDASSGFTNSQADGIQNNSNALDTSVFSIDANQKADSTQTDGTNPKEEFTQKKESTSKEDSDLKEDNIFKDSVLKEDSTLKDITIKEDTKNDATNVSQSITTFGRDDIFGESTITSKKEDHQTYTANDLKKKSNDTLRAILQSQGVELTELHKSAKKQELIQLIIAQQNRR
jgi:hypothetical protein